MNIGQGTKVGSIHFDLTAKTDRYQRAMGEADKSARALNSSLGAVVKTSAQLALLMGAGGGFVQGAKILADFSQVMSTVKAVTQATAEEMAMLTAEAERLGGTTRFSATEAGEAMKLLAQAGMSVSEVMASVGGALTLAQAGGVELGAAAEITGTTLAGFGLKAAEAGRVVDVLAEAANASNSGILDLGEALKFAAPTASALGLTLEETVAIIGKLSDGGLKGGLAGRGFQSLTTQLVNNKDKIEALIGPFNVATDGLASVLRKLREANITTEQVLDIFAGENLDVFQVLSSSALDAERGIENLQQRLLTSKGVAADVAAVMDDNLNGALLNASSAFEALILAIGKAGGTAGLTATFEGLTSILLGLADILTMLSTGPAQQAISAIDKMRIANAAVAEDIPRLTELQDNLAAAIASQGVAAEETARLEIDAIASRIAKNKELAVTYQALARVKLEEAQSQLRELENKPNGWKIDPKTFRELTMDRIRIKQELGQPLKGTEVKWLEEQVRLDKLRADVSGLKQTLADLAKGIGATPPAPGTGDPPGTPPPPASGSSKTAERQFRGAYTALEVYERDLAAIRVESAKGATDANRMAIQSMMDYLEAGGNLRRVLTDVQALSGSLLDPKSVEIINQFMSAMQTAETITVADALETELLDFMQSEAGPWQFFEDRIADATKYGLMSAIETGDWGDAFGQILTDVTRDALSRAIDVLWQALKGVDWGGSGTGISGFLGMLGGSFKPMSGGGPVSAGELLRVGEKGSEWFVPKVDGYIVPNNAGKSLGAPMQLVVGGANVVINGNADARALEILDQRLGAFARALPAVIDARVTDRQKRGAY